MIPAHLEQVLIDTDETARVTSRDVLDLLHVPVQVIEREKRDGRKSG